MKYQSAIEFLSVYSFAILVIAVSISLIFLYANAPKTIIPNTCTAYTGFTCISSSLYNTNFGSQLNLTLKDTQPGTITITNFIGNISSTAGAGICYPANAIQGQNVTCVANFGFHIVNASVYKGAFNVYAHYCPSTQKSCNTQQVFSYGGYVSLQAT
ncbi:MAG: hypothetical protein ACP5RP_01740 [Candidatus Micrarchaeia archaeon]